MEDLILLDSQLHAGLVSCFIAITKYQHALPYCQLVPHALFEIIPPR